MGTVVLNAYSKQYPDITNRIRAAVYLQTDPQVFISQEINEAPHGVRIWTFNGLPRNNYGFVLDEIDAFDNTVSNLASFDIVPGTVDGLLTRDDEQIQVDGTIGLISGETSFIFDGTGDKPNYLGWEIVVDECTGRDIMVKGVDYSWDKEIGQFKLLINGDLFSSKQWYNIHFNSIQQPAGNSFPTVNDFEIIIQSTGRALVANDFGKKIIIEPSSSYLEFTLPNPATVPQGRRLLIETGSGSFFTIKFTPFGAEPIKFNRGNLFMIPNESLSLYCYKRAIDTYEWRVCDSYGNFGRVGELVSMDNIEANTVYDRLILNGFIANINQFARLYYDYVLRLPFDQVVNYDDWTGLNTSQHKFSLANSANPANSGKFHIPNRLTLSERLANPGFGEKAGDFQDWMLFNHKHESPIGELSPSVFGTGDTLRRIGRYQSQFPLPGSLSDLTSSPVSNGGLNISNLGNEIRVKSYLTNKYVIL